MSKLRLRIFDGTRQPFATPAQFLVRIVDGNQTQQLWQYYPQNDITFDLPFFDNFGDTTASWFHPRAISRRALCPSNSPIPISGRWTSCSLGTIPASTSQLPRGPSRRPRTHS